MAFFLQWKSNIIRKVLPNTVSEVPTNVLHVKVALVSPFLPVHPKPALCGLSLETVLAIPCFEAYRLVIFFYGSSDIAWRYVLGHYLAVG